MFGCCCRAGLCHWIYLYTTHRDTFESVSMFLVCVCGCRVVHISWCVFRACCSFLCLCCTKNTHQTSEGHKYLVIYSRPAMSCVILCTYLLFMSFGFIKTENAFLKMELCAAKFVMRTQMKRIVRVFVCVRKWDAKICDLIETMGCNFRF